MPKKRTGENAKKESKKVDELGSGKKAPVPRHAQKAEPKPKPAKAQPAGALSKREAERSLWAPRVEPKAKRAKKTR